MLRLLYRVSATMIARDLRYRRDLAQMSVGTMPHTKVMRAIELLGTEVAPAVRKEIAACTAAG